jgi:glycosyltransferase involved in cell wall biosynthesis
VHLQELAGLPSSLIDVAHAEGVRVVMTLSDYFTLCPTLKLYDSHGEICLRKEPGQECVACCRDAPASAVVTRGTTTSFEIGRLGAQLPRAVRGPVENGLRWAARVAGTTGRRLSGAGPPSSAAAYQRRRDLNLARLGRVDVLVGMSSRVSEIHALLGVDARALRTVHSTLDYLQALSPRSIAEPPRPVRFVTLTGAQSEQKGALVLLDAVKRLDALGLDGEYVLDVYEPVDPLFATRLEACPAVRLRPNYGGRDGLDAALAESHVGIVPSVWEEAYGFVGVELLAKGIPVIGNALGGVPDYTIPGDTGWLNRSCTGEELAEIMAGIIRDPAEIVRLNRSIRERRDDLLKPLDRHLEELDAIYADALR